MDVETNEAAADELRCPLCDYDVRGLPEPRCPECGHGFEWGELTDPARRKLGWLFEHWGTPGRWVRTQVRAMRPLRFWSEVRPSHRLAPRRLVVYAAVSICLLLLGAGLGIASEAVALEQANAPQRAREMATIQSMRVTMPALVPEVLNRTQRYYPEPTTWAFWYRVLRTVTPAVFLQAALQMISLMVAGGIVLGVMRQSFAKAKIKPGHLLRVVVYAADPLPLAVVLVVLGAMEVDRRLGLLGQLPQGAWQDFTPAYVLLGCWLWNLLRLEAGIRRYLGIPRAVVVVFAIGVVGFLAGVLLYMVPLQQ